MNKLEERCKKCGKLLEPSQYLYPLEEGESEKRPKLVCRNYPECPNAEIEINSTKAFNNKS